MRAIAKKPTAREPRGKEIHGIRTKKLSMLTMEGKPTVLHRPGKSYSMRTVERNPAVWSWWKENP
jgi:hypothetical protein